MDPVRIGILGCGSVGDYAMLQPAQDVGALVVTGVASRDREKAAAHAARHGIPHSFDSYQALIDARIADAIYIALPNALHRKWAIAALEAGYPVLCEKPLACTGEDAEAMVAAARASGHPLVEAFHWRYHPLAVRVGELLRGGAIGTLERIDTYFHIPAALVSSDNIRFDPSLGGGSTLDQGCYCVDLIRFYADAEPVLQSAQARIGESGVDLAMRAQLRFGDKGCASIATVLTGEGDELYATAVFRGSGGTLVMENPFVPHLGNRIVVTTPGGKTVEVPTTTPSYIYQAEAFAAIVRDPALAPDGEDMIAGMRLTHAIFSHIHAPDTPNIFVDPVDWHDREHAHQYACLPPTTQERDS